MSETNDEPRPLPRVIASCERPPSHVVGIGASAGGLESLERFFRGIPCDTGMAFVVIQHLSPDFKSMMPELLSRFTGMPIQRVNDGMPVRANEIYLLPPKKEMVIVGGRLRLQDKDPSQGLALPIDRFFASLAAECGPRAVGIVLSGSGSDGSRGVVEISRRGGLVISETSASAKFDSMPVSAQASGSVDLTLATEDIGPTLARYADSPEAIRSSIRAKSTSDPPGGPVDGIEAIFELFRCLYHIDFSEYRDSTIMRRINRRLAILGISDLDEYVRRLEVDSEESDALLEDMLIGVTEFFRDPDTFRHLGKEVFPELLRGLDPQRTVRLWVAGCATGEEAYSLAISLTEACQRLGRPPRFNLFATDIHKTSLEHAGRGLYSEEALRGVSEERRRKFFVLDEGRYQVSPEIRRQVVFAPHNVLQDPPFTDLDFVSCRNLLIYFQAAAQRRAVTTFHYSLRVGGLLLLGGSETPGALAPEFDAISERRRIFRKRRQVRLSFELPRATDHAQPLGLHSTGRKAPATKRRSPLDLQTVYDHLLQRFVPPSLLVDANRQLIDCFGGVEQFLRLPAREPSLDVLDLLENRVPTMLRAALVRAARDNCEVRYPSVPIRLSDAEHPCELTVTPFTNPVIHETHFLITFRPIGEPHRIDHGVPRAKDGEAAEDSRAFAAIEDELRYSKQNLQATIEELESSNEELQATNEELIASNEGLQSTNEELHSVNEELYTVSAEHQRKIGELSVLNRDMNHLLENIDVATVFLDHDLRIRRFTSHINRVYDLIDQDIGRSITSFSPRFRLPDLERRLREVLETGVPSEWDIRTPNDDCFLLRILPYRTDDISSVKGDDRPDERPPLGRGAGPIEGVVLMFVDVSSLEELRGRLRWMSAIVASTDDAIIGQDLDGKLISWNAGAERLYQYTSREAIGQPIEMLVPPERHDEVVAYQDLILKGERVIARDTVRRRKDGTRVHVSLTISPVLDARRRVIGISKIARDITTRIEMEGEIRRQIRQREHFLAILSHELRNPLSAILNAGRLIQDRRSDETTRNAAAGTVERQVGLMRCLLNDLLDVSRIALGKIELKRQRLDLKDLIPAIRETTGPALDKHQTRLRFDTQSLSLPVSGDQARLIQIQVNLIHNASKYSPPGSEISVRMSRQGHWAVVSVSDPGMGISADFIPKLFEPFTQLDEAAGHRDGGLGVGLALVKTLVELHGGEIEVYSAGRDRGTTFTIRLPLCEEPLSPPPPLGSPGSQTGDVAGKDSKAADDDTGTGELGERDASAGRDAVRALRILLVEDIAENREMLQTLLELDGNTVVPAGDGEQALETAAAMTADLALIDIGLPGIDGYEVARRLRATPRWSTVPLVALTGFGQAGDVEQSRVAGFDHHLVKPVDLERLSEIIRLAAETDAIDASV